MNPASHDAEADDQRRARLFVSYSRRDLAFAQKLADALREAGLEVWIDLADIRPSEDWMDAIRAAIESHDAVVFVVSPDSVDPLSVCSAELAITAECDKRLLPVVCRAVDTRHVSVPAAVARLNWISFLDESGFDAALAQLIDALETDLGWLREHTRLTVRAAEWQRAGRDESFVLQMTDLEAAEQWLNESAGRKPSPTPLHTEYVLASRAAATRRRRRLVVAAALAGVLIVGGAAAAAWQALQATERQKDASARSLAAEAQFERTRRLDRAIVLANRAVRLRETPETLDAALSVAHAADDVEKFIRGPRADVTALCFVADGVHLVSLAEDGTVVAWNIERAAPIEVMRRAGGYASLACDPREPRVAVGAGASLLELWRIEGGAMRPAARIEEPEAGFAQLAYSSDGRWLATGGGDRFVLRSANDGLAAEAAVAVETEGGFTTLALSPDGQWIATGSVGRDSNMNPLPGRVSVWQRGDGRPRFVDDAYALATRQVGFGGADGPVFAIGSEGELKAWTLDGKPMALKVPEVVQSNESRSASFDLAGARLITASGRTAVVLHDMAHPDAQAPQSLALHGRAITATALDGAGRRAATAEQGGLIVVHRMRTTEDLRGGQRVTSGDGGLPEAEFSPDGRSVVVRVSGAEPARVVPLAGGSASAAVAPAPSASSRFTVAASGPEARLQPIPDGARPQTLAFDDGDVLQTAVTPDGRHWAAGSLSSVRFADAGSATAIVAMLPPNFGEVTAIALRSDGRLAAVAGVDTSSVLGVRFGLSRKSIILFDTASGRPVGAPLEETLAGEVQTLSFNRGGQYLLSIGTEVAVWGVDPLLRITRACGLLQADGSAPGWAKLGSLPLPEAACEA